MFEVQNERMTFDRTKKCRRQRSINPTIFLLNDTAEFHLTTPYIITIIIIIIFIDIAVFKVG